MTCLELFLWLMYFWLTRMVPATIILVLFLATTNTSMGIRRIYAKVLIHVFEWATENIRYEEKTEHTPFDADSDEEDTATKGENIHLIKKDSTVTLMRKLSTAQPEKSKALTITEDSLEFIKAGIETIIEDEVTSRFSAAQLSSWNLLNRTGFGYQYVNFRLTIIWFLGFLFRYLVLFPVRLFILMIGLVYLLICTYLIGCVPDGRMKKTLNYYISGAYNRILCRSVSMIAKFHNAENKAKPGGICVANHTSPLDVMLLSCDNCYALVGQKQGGLLGLTQRAQSRATHHIWFERAEANDRAAVTRRLREHVEDINKLPILIFPEGTCINNTSVMMFKKGSFEVGGVIYPAAIKYDVRLGDAFWDSSKQGYFQYMIMLMTSWAVMVDVHYLPPMVKRDEEDAIAFAGRVKRAIAEAGGFVELEWDGQLKRYPVKSTMVEKQRERYSRRVISSGTKLNEADGEAHRRKNAVFSEPSTPT